MKYIPISFKTDYSLLKSLIKIKDIITYAKENDAEYAGILDDNPYGIMDFYDNCQKNGIKPVIGNIIEIGEYKIYLYIQNYIGYKNLIQINEIKQKEKLTINDLFKYNEGLICVLPFTSYSLYNRFKNVFETYLGYKNAIEFEKISKVTKNILYIDEILAFEKSDKTYLRVLYKIAGNDFNEENFYIKDAREQDVETITQFVTKLNLEFDFDKKYIPVFCETKEESKQYLISLATKGLEKRLNNNVNEIYSSRLKHEINVIESMGFIDYFLIVYDYVKYAKKNDILVGPGRGSAAGSLVSYSLGITDIDPIKYELLFERFLNPERITMPDIDMDFEDIKREQVIDYVKHKYGENKVSLIVAYGTLGSKQAIRDVSKMLEIDAKIVDTLCKKIDAKKTLKENVQDKSISEFIKNNSLEKMYKIAMKLEGLKKHTTIHAAGVVISSVPITEVIPTYKIQDETLTGYTMEYLEKMGLLKMDFLALRNLTTIHNILNNISKTDKYFNLKAIPLNDSKTFELFKRGDTDNIFQFESHGMKTFLKKLEPSCFDDLIAANALFRPGPMDNIEEYIQRKKGKKPINYLHNDLKPILENTYGIIVYQEQIMQILSKMGGYSYAEADLIRRAMSKKKKEIMEQEKTRFISKAAERGYQKAIAEQVYEMIVKFANYGFNKAHSVAYALIGYQMAYLKTHYFEQFNLNTLNMNMGSDIKTKDVIEDARNKGLEIIKPDILLSESKYIYKDGKIILPLNIIKDISSNTAEVIIENRPYKDFFDFIKKVYGKNVNKNIIERLIKSGSLDCFKEKRITLLENIDSALTYVELCNSLDESLIMKPELEKNTEEDIEIDEIENYGFYISGHPANKYQGANIKKIKNLKNFMRKNVEIIALVEKIKVINTKKGDKMAFITLSDDTGTSESVLFPKNALLLEKIEEGNLYKIEANVNEREQELQIIINEIQSI